MCMYIHAVLLSNYTQPLAMLLSAVLWSVCLSVVRVVGKSPVIKTLVEDARVWFQGVERI